LLEEINSDPGSHASHLGAYNREKASSLKSHLFDRIEMGKRGLSYEKLDQLTIEILLGVK